ncbi:MAG: NAD-dependent deacetylase [Alphaproteobacteria bacterium PA2]|nr:MAG: NAD-dependent deacetylase [Alphaproteobacteria bacterium PA2]
MTTRQDLARLIAAARRMVVFTGAGISTESGIPDFRSPGGVWSQIKPIPFQDFVTDPERRVEAWRRTFSGRAGWVGRAPNDGHRAVRTLWDQGKLTCVITQNVDNLHQASGLPDEAVIELHGNAGYATCLSCGLRHEIEDLRPGFEATETPPSCRACGGVVKVATISFGQSMPAEPMRRAEAAARDCDLFLVLGSSLVVYPAATIPLLARRHGARLVILNREPTDLDHTADLVLNDEIGPCLREIVL